MSNMDYSALIKGEEIEATEPIAPMSLTRNTERWSSKYPQTGHVDENYSIIDEYKIVQLNDKQINVTQENRGQYVPFEMARFYDNIDFADGSITINYVRNGETKATREPAVNVQYTDDRLRFGWLLSKTATSIPGVLKFEVWVEGVGPDGQAYVWKSQPVLKGFEVIKGLGEGEYIELTNDWKQEIVDAFAEKIGESALANYVEKNELNGILTENNEPIYDYIDNHDIVSVEFTNDDNKYEYTLTLKRGDGTTYTNTINLPIESVVVNGSYSPETQTIVLTLKNGETISIPVSGLVSGLASETYVTEAIKTALLDYATKAEIPTKVGELENDAAYATEAYVEAKILEADISEKLTEYAKTAEVEARLGELGVNVDEEGNETPKTVKQYVDESVENVNVTEQLKEYAKIEEVNAAITDITEQLQDYAKWSEVNEKIGDIGEGVTIAEYVTTAVDNVNVKDELENYYTKEEIDNALDNVTVDLTDYYKKEEINKRLGSNINENNSVVQYIEDIVGEIPADDSTGQRKTVKQYIDDQTENTGKKYYRASFNATGDTINGVETTNVFKLWEADQPFDLKDLPEGLEVTAVSQLQLAGTGGGGSGTQVNTLYLYRENNIRTYSYQDSDFDLNQAIIRYAFDGYTAGKQQVSLATAKWEYREGKSSAWLVLEEEDIEPTPSGEFYTFNVSNILTKNGNYQFRLSVSDETGGYVDMVWTVVRFSFYLDIDFDDTTTHPIKDIEMKYIAQGGSEEKIITFKLDGQIIIDPVLVKYTNEYVDITIPIEKIDPLLRHGSHLLEAQMSATKNGTPIFSNIVYKDILLFDPNIESQAPVIGSAPRSYNIMQYEDLDVVFRVFDPRTANPTIKVIEDNGVAIEKALSGNVYRHTFQAVSPGLHTITCVCEGSREEYNATVTITINVEDAGYNINPVSGHKIDFNPVQNMGNKPSPIYDDLNNLIGWNVWSNENNSIIASSNFDWVNGGFQREKDSAGNPISGTEHFCIKSGTYIDLDYKFFTGRKYMTDSGLVIEDYSKQTGKDFKLIFKTTNVKKDNAKILDCVDGLEQPTGIEMYVHKALIHGATESLELPYSEEDIIEFGFQVTKEIKNENGTIKKASYVLGYEDGVATSALVCDKGQVLYQENPKNLRFGSNDCDILIYRIKIYEKELSTKEIQQNFIADARTGMEKINRYKRNQIYSVRDGKQVLDPVEFAKKYPHLRVITIDTPTFTTSKEDPIAGGVIEYYYENGKKENCLSYWRCENAVHVGQGTSSNAYGASGRNLDLILKEHEVNDAVINSGVQLYIKDEEKLVKVDKVSLTADSIPVDYFNVKVNIASSENANNAIFAKRFDRYQPFYRPIIRDQLDQVIKEEATGTTKITKDTMEFYNCVVFLRENADSGHVEFADNDWHYYALGNIGDSKKTDKTRLNLKGSDPKECVIEIMDASESLSAFPRGDGEWKAGNEAYDILHADPKWKDGKIKSFGNGTYEFRYIKEKTPGEVVDNCLKAWRDFYKFIVTSTPSEFHDNLDKWFVVDSALYYYLFTERYSLVDNRAKNSFWHYGKVYYTKEEVAALNEEQQYYLNKYCSKYIVDSLADGDDGYRWDLNWAYDMDTALGTDNDGDIVYEYGFEDIDSIDGVEVFRCSNSLFFQLIRDNFTSELRGMYNAIASSCWSADNLITEFDNWQAQFPEEVWRLDIERKYIRTYTESFINQPGDPDYLNNKAHGRKKYQRRQFEKNQEKYFSSKYLGTKATNSGNQIIVRTVDVSQDDAKLALARNYNLTLKPYSRCYLSVAYGKEDRAVPIRAINTEMGYDFEYSNIDPNTNKLTRPDFIYINNAEGIESVSSLAAMYPDQVKIGPAKKLKTILVGSDAERVLPGGTVKYFNNYLNLFTISDNEILETINIENINFTGTLNTKGCRGLKAFYAKGSTINGFEAANYGAIQVVELPAVKELSFSNNLHLTELSLEGYDNLDTLSVTNCPQFNWQTIIDQATNLKFVYLGDIDWTGEYKLANTELLERLYNLGAIITGSIELSSVKQYDLAKYKEYWKELEIFVEDINIIHQYPVEFRNEDGTLVDTIYVVSGETATRTDKIPTKESTTQYTYEFAYWTLNGEEYLFTQPITGPITLYAVYREHTQNYTINYWLNTKATAPLYTATGKYGDWISYVGEIPTDTSGEKTNGGTFRLFNRWSESGLVNGNKDIYAEFDEYEYDNEDLVKKTISKLSRVELYAVSKQYPTPTKDFPNGPKYRQADSIKIPLGNDYDYDFNDIQTVVNLQGEGKAGDGIVTLTGTKAIPTDQNLFEGDKDFTLAVDFKREGIEQLNAVLFSCLNPDGGFEVTAKAKALTLTWKSGGASTVFELENTDTPAREIMVIRHKAKSPQLDVFFSNTAKDKIFEESRKLSIPIGELSSIDAPLILGARQFGNSYEGYAKETIYWTKVWNACLGDIECRSLAVWPHEQLEMMSLAVQDNDINVQTRAKYTHVIGTKMNHSAFTFMSKYLLDKKTQMGSWNNTEVGWPGATEAINYLNNRLYFGINEKWRQLIKKTSVPYNTRTGVATIENYIFLPSIHELDAGVSINKDVDWTFDIFADNLSRVGTTVTGVVADAGYWTRTVSQYGENYVNFYYIDETGSNKQSWVDSYKHLRIMFTI